MKKNYFYATVEEEFMLLSRICAETPVSDAQEVARQIKQRHFALCRRLIGDFVTPAERVDILAISEGICRVADALKASPLPASELRRVRESAALLGTSPFRFDGSAVSRREQFLTLWKAPLSRDSETVFSALDRLSSDLLRAAVRNA